MPSRGVIFVRGVFYLGGFLSALIPILIRIILV
jgi:hypothetical protein